MAASKDVFEPHVFASHVFASGAFRGTGVPVVVSEGYVVWEAFDCFSPGLVEAQEFVPGLEAADAQF